MIADTTACHGDSGGGFAIVRNLRWFLRGVVSFGNTKKRKTPEGKELSICNEKIPSLYLDLADQMEWIKRNAFPPK
jgi:secreted trypsin-like serine protease